MRCHIPCPTSGYGRKIYETSKSDMRGNSLLSKLLGDAHPVRVGLNLVLIKSSKGAKRWQMLRVIRQRSNQKFVIPWVKAAYAVWGDEEDVSVRGSMIELHNSIFE